MFISVCLLDEELSPEGSRLILQIKDFLVYVDELVNEWFGNICLDLNFRRPKFSWTKISPKADVKEFINVSISLVKVSVVVDQWRSLGEIVNRKFTCRELLRQHVKLWNPDTNHYNKRWQKNIHNATPQISRLYKYLFSDKSYELIKSPEQACVPIVSYAVIWQQTLAFSEST